MAKAFVGNGAHVSSESAPTKKQERKKEEEETKCNEPEIRCVRRPPLRGFCHRSFFFFSVSASYFGTCLRNVRLARIFSLLLMKGKSFVAWLHKLASLCAMLRTHCYRGTKRAMHMLRAFVRCSAFLYVVAISNAEIEAVRLK